MTSDETRPEGGDSDTARGSGVTAVRRQTLAERYGVESPNRRRAKQVAVAAVALVLIGWLGWAAWDHSRSDVSGRLTGYDVVSPHETQVTIEIIRDEGQAVVCDVVALADDHTTVGEASVKAPAGDLDQVRITGLVRTDRAATSVTLSSCRTVR